MIIDDNLIGSLLAEAAASPRLRMNFDLRNGNDDGSQRMLNALMPGTPMPVHRHRTTSETVVVLKGHLTEIFYDNDGVECGRYDLCPASGTYGLQIPAGQWHTIVVHEPTVIMECKDGAYAPLAAEDAWAME